MPSIAALLSGPVPPVQPTAPASGSQGAPAFVALLTGLGIAVPPSGKALPEEGEPAPPTVDGSIRPRSSRALRLPAEPVDTPDPNGPATPVGRGDAHDGAPADPSGDEAGAREPRTEQAAVPAGDAASTPILWLPVSVATPQADPVLPSGPSAAPARMPKSDPDTLSVQRIASASVDLSRPATPASAHVAGAPAIAPAADLAPPIAPPTAGMHPPERPEAVAPLTPFRHAGFAAADLPASPGFAALPSTVGEPAPFAPAVPLRDEAPGCGAPVAPALPFVARDAAGPVADGATARPAAPTLALPSSPTPALLAGSPAIGPPPRLDTAALLTRRVGARAPALIDPPAPGLAAPALAPVVEQPTAAAPQAPVDMARHGWPAAMIDRIARLRDEAEAASTSIRVLPDALGAVDVSVRREGDVTHVHLVAEQPATRALLSEAQPRLTELAEQRGLRLGQTSVEAGAGSGGGGRPPPHPSAPQTATRPAGATLPRRDEPTDDHRIA